MGGTNTEANCTMNHGMLPARGMRRLHPHHAAAAAAAGVAWHEQSTV